MNHNYWMQEALNLADEAKAKNEVPIGAIVVYDNRIIGRGFNQPISSNDPTAHAEIVALRQAAITFNNYRLINTSLYVTLEPCIMCAGALVHARIQNLIFGAKDSRAGAICSNYNLLEQKWLNHKITWYDGILEQECGDILKEFFLKKREKI